MTNTRPVSTPEFLKKKFDHEKTHFDKDGVCFACKYAEYKRKVNWKKREQNLIKLLRKYKRKDGGHDVIVPGSGGKDSFAVAHKLKYKYSMNQLTVTWAPHSYTDIGKYNHEAWINSGLDNILVNPPPTFTIQDTEEDNTKRENVYKKINTFFNKMYSNKPPWET